MLNDSTRESLGEINRDESTRLLWNVIRTQPKLVLMGLQGITVREKVKGVFELISVWPRDRRSEWFSAQSTHSI